MTHHHQAGRPCSIAGCTRPRIAEAVDRVLADVEPGRTVPRSYIREALADLDYGAMRYGEVARARQRVKGDAGSSRGSRLGRRIANRLRVLVAAGALQRIGQTHVLVVDMFRAPPLRDF